MLLLKQEAAPYNCVPLSGILSFVSLMWNTANFNRVCVGPLGDSMLMKEYTVGNPPEDFADWRAPGKV